MFAGKIKIVPESEINDPTNKIDAEDLIALQQAPDHIFADGEGVKKKMVFNTIICNSTG